MIDTRPWRLVNEQTYGLLLAFSLLAFLVSPISPIPRRAQDRLVGWFPLPIFLYWLLFQFMLLSLNRHVHYYLNGHSVFPCTINSGICIAFGIAFSIRTLRIKETAARIVAVFWLVVFLLLLMGVQTLRPVVQET